MEINPYEALKTLQKDYDRLARQWEQGKAVVKSLEDMKNKLEEEKAELKQELRETRKYVRDIREDLQFLRKVSWQFASLIEGLADAKWQVWKWPKIIKSSLRG